MRNFGPSYMYIHVDTHTATERQILGNLTDFILMKWWNSPWWPQINACLWSRRSDVLCARKSCIISISLGFLQRWRPWVWQQCAAVYLRQVWLAQPLYVLEFFRVQGSRCGQYRKAYGFFGAPRARRFFYLEGAIIKAAHYTVTFQKCISIFHRNQACCTVRYHLVCCR